MDYHELAKMTVNQLREEAKKFPDVRAVSAMKKDELVHMLAERLDIEIPKKHPINVKHKPVLDKATLKKKLGDLREQREAARGADDRRKVDVLRRRMHLVKRQIRKLA